MQDNIFILPTRQVPTEPGQAAPSNLPMQLTPFIGREAEVAAVSVLLRRAEVRLLTLTGTGGVGKTRLALEVAENLQHDFSNGIFFVSLAPISDPELVIPTIAHTLDLWEARDQSLVEKLQTYLEHRHLLLLLDNFEQVIEAGPQLVEVLLACPNLKILVTSRATLGLYGEYEYVVPALAVPDIKHLPPIEEFAHYAAIALFMQQAQAIKPDFRLSRENARAIAEICVRLDGLPLALELAASRIKLLPPKMLLERLQHRLQVLTGGARNLPLRQQTLRNTIAWSYDLLSDAEQRLFRRLSVFGGGCTLEAVEAISTALGDGSAELLEKVASLINKSLLQQIEREDGEARLLLLETIREYALEQLAAHEEMGVTRQAHAYYYLQLAEQAEPKFGGPEQTVWLERLEREYDNLRSAMGWLLEQEGTADGDQAIDTALRLGGALREFWSIHDHSSEGLSFLERVLAWSQGGSAPVRAKALSAAAHMAYIQDSNDRALALAKESLRLYRELGDTEGIALSLHHLEKVARMQGDLGAARTLITEALALWRGVGNQQRIGWSLFRLARQLVEQGEYTEARRLFEESLAIFRSLAYKEGMAYALFRLAEMLLLAREEPELIRLLLSESLAFMREVGDKEGETLCVALAGRVALAQGDTALARTLIEDSLLKARQMDYKFDVAEYRYWLANVAVAQGDYVEASIHYQDSLEVFREDGDKWHLALCLEGLAGVLVEVPVNIRWAAGDQGTTAPVAALWAARLCGMSEALRETMGTPLPPIERPAYARTIAAARTQLGEEAFVRAQVAGRSMSLEQVFFPPQEPDLILAQVAKVLQPVASEHLLSTYPAGLTEREVEVLRLVAQGLTNSQIAEQLIISLHTVNAHMRSIFNKLGVNSRNAVTRFAIERNL